MLFYEAFIKYKWQSSELPVRGVATSGYQTQSILLMGASFRVHEWIKIISTQKRSGCGIM